ncbi:MAG: SOS response-associated peptidase [Rhodospirillales bacterium]
MCGRYSITTAPEALRALFAFEERPNLAPRFNVAPTQSVPVVRRDRDGGRHLAALRWGLVPPWAKDLAIGAKMINARAETVAEKPAFRKAFAQRRCLVLADGFYEWRPGKTGKAPKQPFRMEFAERAPFAFAGLWERWGRDDGAIESVTIITCPANSALEALHHRMPVILEPQAFEAWLDPQGAATASSELLRPYDQEAGAYGPLRIYPVSTRLNKATNDDASLLEPIDPELPRLL